MKNKKKELILVVLGILSLVLITIGVTYAFFNYAKEGTTENTLSTGTIEFLYTEVDKQGAGISIEDAYPMSDSLGKAQTASNEVFNFKVTSKLVGEVDIPYEVTARKKSTSTLDEDAVRIYLTEVIGDKENELLLDNYGSLTQSEKVDEAIAIEKTLYKGLVPTGSTNYEKNFRLRMWIDDSIKFTQNEDGTYPYNDKEFTITVNVYANAKVVTESEIDYANTTEIERLTVNGTSAMVADSQDYDYIIELPDGTSSIDINVETANENATVEIEKLDSLAFVSNVKKLSTIKTFDLNTGDNYFKITVTSENKQLTDNYIIRANNTKPVAPVITGATDGWGYEPITISLLTEGSSLSGVKEYEYYKSVAQTKPLEETEPTGITPGDLIINDDGTNYIWYRTVSNSGYKSEWSNVQLVKIDTTEPKLTLNPDLPSSLTPSNEYAIIKTYTTSSLSGGTKVCVSSLDGTLSTNYTSSLTTSGTHKITCTVTTGAGKSVSISTTITLVNKVVVYDSAISYWTYSATLWTNNTGSTKTIYYTIKCTDGDYTNGSYVQIGVNGNYTANATGIGNSKSGTLSVPSGSYISYNSYFADGYVTLYYQ